MASIFYPQVTSLRIEIEGTASRESVELKLTELEPDCTDVLKLLTDESATLNSWIEVALAYYRMGNETEFLRVLSSLDTKANIQYPEAKRDQIRVLEMFALYHFMLSNNRAMPEEERSVHKKKSIHFHCLAAEIDDRDSFQTLCSAFFSIQEGERELALKSLELLLNRDARNIPALLMKARILYSTKDYEGAQRCYNKVKKMTDGSDFSQEFHLGLGYCMAKLDNWRDARSEFALVVEAEPKNARALAAFGIASRNVGIDSGEVLAIMKESSRLEYNNPVVLNYLADHAFHVQNFVECESCARAALRVAKDKEIRAESKYHLARMFHQNGDLDAAFELYNESIKYGGDAFMLPIYGLGQLFISRNELHKAIACFEKVLEVYPRDFDTQRILASLYANVRVGDEDGEREKRHKTINLLKGLLKKAPNDLEILLELAQISEGLDSAASLDAYERAAGLMDPNVPPEIFNNIGSIHLSLNNYDGAREFFELALSRVKELSSGKPKDTAALSGIRNTVSYNLGRLKEMIGLVDEAERIYRNVLESNRHYIDCYLRLGCIARDRERKYEASVLFKEGLAEDHTNADPWLLLGNMHLANGELVLAKRKFEYVLNQAETHHDSYAMVALGNYWLEMFYAGREADSDETSCRRRALYQFKKALVEHPGNVWAAHGIGCALASVGVYEGAYAVFASVLLAKADFPDVHLNMGHVCMKLKKFDEAIRAYDGGIRRFGISAENPRMLKELARAYCKAGNLPKAKETIDKAMKIAPNDPAIRFYHAAFLRKCAKNVVSRKPTLEALTKAVEDLNTAKRTFFNMSRYQAIMNAEGESTDSVLQRAAEIEFHACDDILLQATYLMHKIQADAEKEEKCSSDVFELDCQLVDE